MSTTDDPPAPPGYRYRPCEGQAHHPAMGGMIDNCAMCLHSPRWGEVQRLTHETIRKIAQGERRGGAGTSRELARVVDAVLNAVNGGRHMREILTDLRVALKDYTL